MREGGGRGGGGAGVEDEDEEVGMLDDRLLCRLPLSRCWNGGESSKVGYGCCGILMEYAVKSKGVQNCVRAVW